MAKKKKVSLKRKLLIIVSVLILVQVALVVFLSSGGSKQPFPQQLRDGVSADSAIPPERRAYVELQGLLRHYRAEHGAFPQSLHDMIPVYFEAIPTDPETGGPFRYQVSDSGYLLGEEEESRVAPVDTRLAVLELEEDRQELLAALSEGVRSVMYDPSGKRDPFRSFDFSPKKVAKVGDTPLEQHDYEQLRFSAVIRGAGEARALIEDPYGRGHTVSVGDKVGSLGGKIVAIEEDRILILESTIDFTGEQITRTVEMYMR